MIRHTSSQRAGVLIVGAPVALFALVGVVANLVNGGWHDVAGLLVLVTSVAGLVATRWTRFVAFDDERLSYRNWLFVHTVPWDEVDRVDIRSLFQPRSRGWAVVAHRRTGLPITLRATGRSGSSRRSPPPGRLAVEAIARALDEARIGARPSARP